MTLATPAFSFTKYHGLGNDFILVDARHQRVAIDPSLFAQLCRRHFGVGADGVLVLAPSHRADALLRTFNADGTEAAMCGNGLRCAAHLLAQRLDRSEVTLASPQRLHRCTVDGLTVSATLGAPEKITSDLVLSLSQGPILTTYVDTGVPHLVLFVDDLTTPQFAALAKKLRFHPTLAPAGANVNFAQKTSSATYSIRTYERGVEQETLACGTGAAATAVAAWYRDSTSTHLTIQTASKMTLTFDLFPSNHLLKEVRMTGGISPVFEGVLHPLHVHNQAMLKQVVTRKGQA